MPRGDDVAESNEGGAAAKVTSEVDPAGQPIVTISGELDLASVEAVRTAIEPLLAESPKIVTFDLEGLSFMDSSGIALLVQVSNRVGNVKLLNASSIVRRVLEATGLLELFGLDT
jgi:anti-sigma B factor antagonist